jgi:hypothetical protein
MSDMTSVREPKETLPAPALEMASRNLILTAGGLHRIAYSRKITRRSFTSVTTAQSSFYTPTHLGDGFVQ